MDIVMHNHCDAIIYDCEVTMDIMMLHHFEVIFMIVTSQWTFWCVLYEVIIHDCYVTMDIMMLVTMRS